MLFAVRFHDKPNQSALRTTHFDAHIDWLRLYREKILAAGSLRSDPEAAPVGGLWIVQAAHKEEVEELLR
ncbi:YciI family protein [Cupriavidus agavae]|uniref:YciI family protein n=1 Tax=Cupriavidus agavae TaxID=1001822 RepID=UPI00102B26E8